MVYYLDDIKSLLVSQGYDNIYIDYLIEKPAENTALGESILLYAQGGVSNTNTPLESRDFAIYVRRKKSLVAQTIAEAVYQYLDSYQGGITGGTHSKIRRIITRQSPMPFPTSSKLREYVMTFTAEISNKDRVNIK
jgi:hypothetical protein